jgi:Transposase
MHYDIPSSPIVHEAGDNWNTPKRARVRQMRRDGNSWGAIKNELGVKRSTAQSICKDSSSRTTRKGKVYHHRLINTRTIRQIIRHISRNYPSRRLSFEQVRRQLNLTTSARTIRRELRHVGYRRYISYPRPYILYAQAKKRLDFTIAH